MVNYAVTSSGMGIDKEFSDLMVSGRASACAIQPWRKSSSSFRFFSCDLDSRLVFSTIIRTVRTQT
jgi:hypothetical protein